MALSKVKVFSLSSYLEAALKLAEYERDDDGVVIATVPSAPGFFAQGDTHEEARANLEDVIEGNVLLALQLGWEVPPVPGVNIKERDVETDSAQSDHP
ncbi:MAG: type II toxin-antitoxin system HicB family antitoxin [Chloroflexi bacterium]|nr:type II toxin-antitoxin system HicB family antitoxin [Chloroflexota bacterium]